jgi:NTE family protein
MSDSGKLKKGIGLALSGGGFRATLFHTGSLWRLNELGLLGKIDRICSVSGGSITAGVLAHRWKNLRFNEHGVATNFVDEIATPLRDFCARNIDVPDVIAGLLNIFRSISDMIVGEYKKHLFGEATLQDLPSQGEGPNFIIYATSLQTGDSVRLSKAYLADYKVGMIRNPNLSLAACVAASSAFPPILSPVIVRPQGEWIRAEGAILFDQKDYRDKMVLSDGGVYDNLGLEAVWNNYQTVLVSDAGAPLGPETDPSRIWHKQLLRALGIITEQTRALRKRKLVEDYIKGERKGTYWGIMTHINNYELPNAMVTDNALTGSLCKIRTRLNKFSDKEQGHLINWGYALTDTALRKHVLPSGATVGQWPVPDFPLV